MAETSSPPSPPPPPPSSYWCYHCDKRVGIETSDGQPDDVICNECKFGFIESLPLPLPTPIPTHSNISPPSRSFVDNGGSDDSTLGSQFLHVLRLLAHVAREDDAPPPPSRPLIPDSDNDDFLRIEIEEDSRSFEIEPQSDEEDHQRGPEHEEEEDERDEDIRRSRRDVLRLRLRDIANRSRSEGQNRNRLLDWAEILMGLEDNSIEFRFELPETDRYIGNPSDYVDAAEYEALLQNLAEADGRRGAPPAAKSAVENLRTVEIKSEVESYICAVCKDGVNVGDIVKEMPCGHGYHGECLVPWLAARNSCPVCRFELATDDPEYEEERKKKVGGSQCSSSASSGGND